MLEGAACSPSPPPSPAVVHIDRGSSYLADSQRVLRSGTILCIGYWWLVYGRGDLELFFSCSGGYYSV